MSDGRGKYGSIEIQFDEENTPEDALREVLRLIQEGYTSGYNPRWAMIPAEEE